MPEQEPHQDPDELGQGIDEGVVVSADAGTVSGLGAAEELDEIDEQLAEEREQGS
jgi:hypothetical protein